MTKKDFLSLSEKAQEDFINNGGKISADCEPQQIEQTELCHTSPLSASENSSSIVFKEESQSASPLIGGNVASATKIISPLESSDSKGASPFDGLLIDNPLDLLYLVDEEIISGRVKPHDWQAQFMLDFAEGGITDKEPFQAIVRAANGSGKDKYIIAFCAVWLCMRYKETIAVVTSASGSQLDTQTCRHIKRLAESVNRKFGGELWDCKYRQFKFCFGGGQDSQIFCYATDEPGKAEGYHPNAYGAKMALFLSEDKTIDDDINIAINKCTGYTHRVHASTPGPPVGHFFSYDQSAIPRLSIKSVHDVQPTDWIRYHVTAFQCDHLSKNYFKQMEEELPGGKNGAAYKSQVLAEFGTTDEMVVIPYMYVYYAVNEKIDWIPEDFNTGGLDLADGGAETVLSIRNGNKLLKQIPFKFNNSEDTIAFLIEQFIENSLNNPNSLIYADCVGIGKPMLDRMKKLGWSNIKYIDSRAKAQYPKTYLNRGTELFFNMSKLMSRKEIILPRDKKLMDQLGSRYYKITSGNIHQLLSKIEQRSRGYPSPDRADSANLCFWNYKSTISEEAKESEIPFEQPKEKELEEGDFTLKGWANGDGRKWQANNGVKQWNDLEEEIASYNRKILTNN